MSIRNIQNVIVNSTSQPCLLASSIDPERISHASGRFSYGNDGFGTASQVNVGIPILGSALDIHQRVHGYWRDSDGKSLISIHQKFPIQESFLKGNIPQYLESPPTPIRKANRDDALSSERTQHRKSLCDLPQSPQSAHSLQSSNILAFYNNTRKFAMPISLFNCQQTSSAPDNYYAIKSSEDSDQDATSVKKSPEERTADLNSNRKRTFLMLPDNDDASTDGAHKKPNSTYSSPAIPSKSQHSRIQVRREKLGDRITALQRLVCPFGKTDTASVLLEAIGYIKFLQEQVRVLSSAYIKPILASKESSNKSCSRDGGESVVDLRSRGLCLVPMSNTLKVANNDIGADFWSGGGSHQK